MSGLRARTGHTLGVGDLVATHEGGAPMLVVDVLLDHAPPNIVLCSWVFIAPDGVFRTLHASLDGRALLVVRRAYAPP